MRQVIDIAHELAQALDAAHRRGIVHRDLKPANVMLTPQGHVKVMDFGLAEQVAERPSPPGAGAVSDTGTQTHDGVASTDARVALTDAGTRIGTRAYMSPEQILGAALDPRSDLFSLGVILHELATGRHPFLRDDPSDTMAAILRDPPTPGSRDLDEPAGFGAVIHRLLSKACAERHQTTTALLDDLEALRTNAWTTSRSTAPATPAERTPFVGRDSESTELTRLARELLATARQRGCLGLTGHCYEMDGAAPYVPFVESIEQAVHLLPQAVRAAMGEVAPEIAAIVPSLRRTYSDIPPLPELPADQQRRLIFDESTLQLLQHLAPHLASLRLLVVGTYRDVELDVKRPFAKTLESLLRQRLATRIALRRLPESSAQELLTRMSGSAPPSGLVTAVFRETEGNPFFVEEVYQHPLAQGDARRQSLCGHGTGRTAGRGSAGPRAADRERLALLYPLTLAYVQTGRVHTSVVVGPGSPHLVAALAADAAGLIDREHFETALRQAHEVPIRILQPTVRYWYGRALSTGADVADRARGRAMAEAALPDFRGLEMVLHANLAEQFLRDGR